jgi:hypothetical protein
MALSVTISPTSDTIQNGQSITFTGSWSYTSQPSCSYSYIWYLNGTSVDSGSVNGTDLYSGSQTYSITFEYSNGASQTVEFYVELYYSDFTRGCIGDNGTGSATSDITVTQSSFTESLSDTFDIVSDDLSPQLYVFTILPSNQNISSYSTPNPVFSLNVTSGSYDSYIWYFNGNQVGTSSTYAFQNISNLVGLESQFNIGCTASNGSITGNQTQTYYFLGTALSYFGEGTTISESITHILVEFLNDAISLVEKFFGDISSYLSDIGELSDLGFYITDFLSDSLSIIENTYYGLKGYFSDSVNILEIFRLLFSSTFSETVSDLIENFLSKIFGNLSDSSSLTDRGFLFDGFRTLNDSNVLEELLMGISPYTMNIYSYKTPQITLQGILSNGNSPYTYEWINNGITVSTSQSYTLDLSDVVGSQYSLSFTLNITDSTGKIYTQNSSIGVFGSLLVYVGESNVPSDRESYEFFGIKSDDLTILDSITDFTKRLILNLLNISEAFSKNTFIPISSLISIGETYLFKAFGVLSDQVDLTDLEAILNMFLKDAVSFVEGFSKLVGLFSKDSLSFGESIFFYLKGFFGDNVSIFEALSDILKRILKDSSSISELFTFLFSETFSELFSLVETFFKKTDSHLSDTISILETLVDILKRILKDSSSVSEFFNFLSLKRFSELFSLVETFFKYTHSNFNDVVSIFEILMGVSPFQFYSYPNGASSVTLQAMLSNGNSPYTYEWINNGSIVSTSESYTVNLSNVVGSESSIVFTSKITDSKGNVYSQTSTLTVFGNILIYFGEGSTESEVFVKQTSIPSLEKMSLGEVFRYLVDIPIFEEGSIVDFAILLNRFLNDSLSLDEYIERVISLFELEEWQTFVDIFNNFYMRIFFREAISLSETFSSFMKRILREDVSLEDILSYYLKRLNVDSLTLSEIFSKFTKLFPFSENITTIIESILEKINLNYLDSISPLEKIVFGIFGEKIDSLSIDEVFSKFTKVFPFSETITTIIETIFEKVNLNFSDLISPLEVIVLGIFGEKTDSLSITEVISKLSVVKFSEILSLVESFIKKTSRKYINAVGIFEKFVYIFEETFTDLDTLSEYFLKEPKIKFLETVPQNEYILFGLKKVIRESISLLEVFGRIYNTFVLETLVHSETVLPNVKLKDVVNISEIFGFFFDRKFKDTVGKFLEFIRKEVFSEGRDLVSLLEFFNSKISAYVSEDIVLDENFSAKLFRLFTSVISLYETLQKSTLVRITDKKQLKDFFSFIISVPFSDGVDLSEKFEPLFDLFDSLDIREFMNFVLSKNFINGVSVSDRLSFVLEFYNALIRALESAGIEDIVILKDVKTIDYYRENPVLIIPKGISVNNVFNGYIYEYQFKIVIGSPNFTVFSNLLNKIEKFVYFDFTGTNVYQFIVVGQQYDSSVRGFFREYFDLVAKEYQQGED